MFNWFKNNSTQVESYLTQAVGYYMCVNGKSCRDQFYSKIFRLYILLISHNPQLDNSKNRTLFLKHGRTKQIRFKLLCNKLCWKRLIFVIKTKPKFSFFRLKVVKCG